MKKINYWIIVLFLLTGCIHQEKIVVNECTFFMEQGSSLIDVTYLFESDENTKKIKKQESTIIFTLGTADEVDYLLNTFEQLSEAYSEVGIDYSYSADGLKVMEKTQIDFDTVDLSKLVELKLVQQVADDIPTIIDVDSSIEHLIKQGFSCSKK